ncbi:unnamed protein product, partial [Brachionus calyciflorus]
MSNLKFSYGLLIIFLIGVQCFKGQYYNRLDKEIKGGFYGTRARSLNTKCHISSDLTPVYSQCSKFNNCLNGVLYIETCPYGTVFDRIMKACAPPELVPRP